MALGQQQTLNSKGFLTQAPSGTHGTRAMRFLERGTSAGSRRQQRFSYKTLLFRLHVKPDSF